MSSFEPAPDRQRQILSRLNRQGRLSVAEIVSQFSISAATARRDLAFLAARGSVQRVHGGAMAAELAPPEAPILQRRAELAGEKARIGRLAAGLVAAKETVFLGSGSTVLEVARNLRGRPELTVITNSLPVINALSGLEGITLIGLGGMLRTTELSFIGHITDLALAELRVDKVIMGVRGISLDPGLTSDFLPETLTDRAILKIAREVIIVADHSKINRISSARLAPLDAVDRLVTDKRAPRAFVAALRRRKIEVLLA
jgi:DeoR/GlpR family transcriptional regulator of sugar metabolism